MDPVICPHHNDFTLRIKVKIKDYDNHCHVTNIDMSPTCVTKIVNTRLFGSFHFVGFK